MEYTMQQRCDKIAAACMEETGICPEKIFENIAAQDFVRMHGPEHHIIDGGCILAAYHNAGGAIDLEQALKELRERALQMPGAMCGNWAMCGSVTSIGAALSIIDGTGPLAADGSWGNRMRFSAAATARMAEINGPRCCKRDAHISIAAAVDYINAQYDVKLEQAPVHCTFSSVNPQCIGDRCPYKG